MCRRVVDGGRRCPHTPYAVTTAKLRERKRYHESKASDGSLSAEVRGVHTNRAAEASSSLNSWQEEHETLGAGQGFVMNVSPATEKVLSTLENAGLRPFIVGGSVRDQLLGLPSKDVDIEVYGGTPTEVSAALRALGRVDEVGAAFGVLKTVVDGEDFDVSLPRTDSKVGDGHKGFDVQVDPDLSYSEATARRDFTINALMYSHKHGFILDPHGGVKDLHNKVLRHVSDAFGEDPLRVLRGVQMSSRFGMDMHPDTVTVSKKLRSGFDDLATERVREEFAKLYLKGKDTQKALKLLNKTGWDSCFPGLSAANGDDLRRTVGRAQQLVDKGVVTAEKREVFMGAVISHTMSQKDRLAFLRGTMVRDREKTFANNLCNTVLPVKQGKASIKEWVHRLPNGVTARDWCAFQDALGDGKKAGEVLNKVERWGVADNPEPVLVDGNDIMSELGEKPGRWLKSALDRVRQAQYSDGFKTRHEALQWVRRNRNAII